MDRRPAREFTQFDNQEMQKIPVDEEPRPESIEVVEFRQPVLEEA